MQIKLKHNGNQLSSLSSGFGSIIQSNGNPMQFSMEELKKMFSDSGAILFRNFDFDFSEMKNFSDSFGEKFLPYTGGPVNRTAYKSDPTIVSALASSGEGAGINLHGEQYYQAITPDTIWFYCEVAPKVAGETTLCDGVELFKSLRAETQEFLRSRKLVFHRYMSKENWQRIYSCRLQSELAAHFKQLGFNFDFDNQEGVRLTYSFSPVRKVRFGSEISFINNVFGGLIDTLHLRPDKSPHFSIDLKMDDGKDFPSVILDELLEISSRLTVNVKWENGDLVMVDNSRVMHGRKPYGTQERKIWVRISKAQ